MLRISGYRFWFKFYLVIHLVTPVYSEEPHESSPTNQYTIICSPSQYRQERRLAWCDFDDEAEEGGVSEMGSCGVVESNIAMGDQRAFAEFGFVVE